MQLAADYMVQVVVHMEEDFDFGVVDHMVLAPVVAFVVHIDYFEAPVVDYTFLVVVHIGFVIGVVEDVDHTYQIVGQIDYLLVEVVGQIVLVEAVDYIFLIVVQIDFEKEVDYMTVQVVAHIVLEVVDSDYMTVQAVAHIGLVEVAVGYMVLAVAHMD